MFRELMGRTRSTVPACSVERVEDPLETDDASYLAFFTRLVERLEASSTRWDEIRDAECRDLLRQASTRVFSNLLCIDGSFNFDQVLSPVPEEIQGKLA